MQAGYISRTRPEHRAAGLSKNNPIPKTMKKQQQQKDAQLYLNFRSTVNNFWHKCVPCNSRDVVTLKTYSLFPETEI